MYVFTKAKKLLVFGWVPLILTTYPILVLLSSTLVKIYENFGRQRTESQKELSCLAYIHREWFNYLQEVLAFLNEALVNYFLLRIFSVAAILRCKSIEEEYRSKVWVNRVNRYYFPTYLILKLAVYCSSLYLWSSVPFKLWAMASLLIITNVLKASLTLTLSLYTLKFSGQVK